MIQQHFALRNVEDEPEYYLGANITRLQDGRTHISCKKYIADVIRKYKQDFNITLKKQSIPMRTDSHPEKDTSDLLGAKEHKEFQHIIGICHWIVTMGRFDISHAVSSLSRFSQAPRKEHLTMTRHMLGYLKKFKKRGIAIDAKPLTLTPEYASDVAKQCKLPDNFGNQYKYLKKSWTQDSQSRWFQNWTSACFVIPIWSAGGSWIHSCHLEI